MKTLLLALMLQQSTCPLGSVWVDQISRCAVPLWVFPPGVFGPALWQPNDWNMDGQINIVDIQLMINAALTGQLTLNNIPATVVDVQNTINAAFQPYPATSPGTTTVTVPIP